MSIPIFTSGDSSCLCWPQPPFVASLPQSKSCFSGPAASHIVTQTLWLCPVSLSSPSRIYLMSNFSLPPYSSPLKSLILFPLPPFHKCDPFTLLTLLVFHASLHAGSDILFLLSHEPSLSFLHIFSFKAVSSTKKNSIYATLTSVPSFEYQWLKRT